MQLFSFSTRVLTVLLFFYALRPLPAQEITAPAQSGQAQLTSSSAVFPVPEGHFDLALLSQETFRYHQSFDLLQTQAAPPTPPPGKPQPPEKIKRTSIDPSMVGYIDDASVTTEVRIRFDAALDDQTPDRAEFFYGKCGCYRGLPTTSSAYDPHAPGPGPGIPQDINFQQLYLRGEYAYKGRISLLAEIPIRWLQPHEPAGTASPFSSSAGISDVRFGLKVAGIATPRTSLTFQFLSGIPTGDAGRGLGTNHASIEPAILFDQRISGRFSLAGEIGDNHPIGGSRGVPTAGSGGFAGDVFFYGIGPSYMLINHESFNLSPVLEFVGWHIFGGYATGRTTTDGVNISNLKIGPRMNFGRHSSLYVGYGIALTSQTWYREIFRTEYRYAF